MLNSNCKEEVQLVALKENPTTDGHSKREREREQGQDDNY